MTIYVRKSMRNMRYKVGGQLYGGGSSLRSHVVMTHPSIGQSFFNHTDLFFICSIYFYLSTRDSLEVYVLLPPPLSLLVVCSETNTFDLQLLL